jgi:hypothetical protein
VLLLHAGSESGAQFVLTEFLAENNLGLKDDDGNREDWIEIHNPGGAPASLAGWSLTDDRSRPRAWEFPDLTLRPGEFLVVFASGKDRRTLGGPLHTNFRLSTAGEYLGLIRPDGTVATEFAPAYPAQVPDVSFGFPVSSQFAPLLQAGAPGRFLVPNAASPPDFGTWMNPEFNDSAWTPVTTAIGWDATPDTGEVPVADSIADWNSSGIQGYRGWRYGAYSRFLDANGSYSPVEFVEFGTGEWDGSNWRNPAAGNARTRVGPTHGLPGGSNTGGERWAIRRWNATVAGNLTVQWTLRKRATGGTGVNGRIYQNGTLLDSAILPGSDTAGIIRTLSLTNVALGDAIDLTLTPIGSGGTADDTADEAAFGMVVSAKSPMKGWIATDVAETMRGRNASGLLRIPFVVTNLVELDQLELRVRHDDGFAAFLNGTPVVSRRAPVEAAGGVVAEQSDDWAGTSDQGFKGWYYGYYDQTSDPDRTYDPSNDFINTGPGWNWDGQGWSLGPGDPPWTSIARDTWHPNGTDGGGNVQWAIRRWVSQTAGTVKALVSVAKQNPACGNGVTFRILVNGQPRFTRTLAANDTAGFTTTVLLENLEFGVPVDFVLDPTGTDGSTQDGCDGSTFLAQILQDPSPGPAWNSRATASRSTAEAVRIDTFDLSRSRDRLVAGTNLLALQVLNASPDDADLLMLPEIVGRYARLNLGQRLYFTGPTPGNDNRAGAETLGPVVDQVTHSPNVPADHEDLVVRAVVRRTLRPVAGVSLAYRVMYAAEQTTAMFDDGRHEDGAAGDGIWAARIPATAASPGQMIRWAVTATDDAGRSLRHPAYPDPRRSPQYEGTVVLDPSLTSSRIPVLHWFIATPSSADTDTGARGSLFFEGEFYDNILANVHGQSTRGFPKRSYDIDFNPGHKFRWREGQPRVDDLNLLTTWADKSHLRNVMAYETYERAGAPAHFAFAVRVQQNARFHSLANLVENGDDNFLERLGLDPQGALYKMYNTASDVSGGEKKTRKTEGTQDLAELIAGFRNGTTATRTTFLYDNLDVPGVINFLAARALTGDTDCCHKNYYFYRDSNRSREWTAFPWDVDLSFGRVWTCNSPCLAYYDETIYTNTGLFVGDGNTVFSVVLNSPTTRQMYLRRLRSLADQLTQPPGTAPAEDLWLQRTTQLRDLLAPAANLDLAKWGTWGRRETITQAVSRIHNEFLRGRRNYLFLRSVPGTLPQAQASNVEVRISGAELVSAGGSSSQEYLSLTNANPVAVDVSDWRLEGLVRFRFKPGTVIPSRSTLFVAADRTAFRSRASSPRGGESRFVVGNYSGDLSSRGGPLSLLDATGRTVHALQLPGTASPAQRFLRLTEIHFHPPDAEGPTEFLELRNTGPDPLALAGVRFTEGVAFDFSTSSITSLAPGARLLVVQNLAAFRTRYGTTLPVAGQYTGSLDNAGERLRLVDARGETILDFRFDPARLPAADGLGFSIVAGSDTADWTAWDTAGFWRPANNPGGSPGADDPASPAPRVVLNEILTHTDPPQLDAVELHNPSNEPVDLGGWWLSDDPARPLKFRLPAGSVIPAGGFLVFDERQFNAAPGTPGSFALSSHGDELWLFAADAQGRLTGPATGASFEASANGVSFGRHTNSAGAVHYVPQRTVTLGAPNSGPRTGPVILQEIHFAPARGDFAFLELRNITAASVPLFDPAFPTNTWRIEGVDFDFPTGLTLPPGGTLLVVQGDAVRFRLAHGIPGDVPILGPWKGTLQPNGERLALVRPDSPDPRPEGGALIPRLIVDEVRFRDAAPWPVTAATPGQSLERIASTAWGDDPAHWRASSGPPTPGTGGAGNRPPSVAAGPEQTAESIIYPVTLKLSGTARDDGLPEVPGQLTVLWSQLEGPGLAEWDNPRQPETTVRFPGPGRYVLRLSAFDGEWSRSADVVLTLTRPASDLLPVPEGSGWRYFAQGREPGANWTTAGFDDRSWPSANAQFGYGDGDERTLLPSTVNGSRLLTAYFRRAFVVEDPASVRSVTLRLLRDDGAAVWLNGQSVFRSNLPEGALTYATLATATVSGVDESTFLEQTLNPSALRTGTNVIAVEIHQQSEGSSDISFDLELRMIAQPANRGPTVSLPGPVETRVGQPLQLAATWQDDGLPGPATLRWTQLAGPAALSFSATNLSQPFVTASLPGNYDLRFTVSDGLLLASRDLRLVATAQDSPDFLAWMRDRFTPAEMAQPGITANTADPDRDGMNNFNEFVAGTNPRDPASALRISATLAGNGELRLVLSTIAGRAYRVLWSDTATGGTWQELGRISPSSTDGTATLTDPRVIQSKATRFYRVAIPVPGSDL